MADHTELISEMPALEKLSTQERLKLARKRRGQQLKKWSQREKEYNNNKRKKVDDNAKKNKLKKNDYKVHFVPSVMLLEAAARNDVEEVRRLLMLGVSPDSTNEDGLTALHQCCIDDSEEMMKLLIDFGANVNAKDSEQWTPLHAAATCGHLHLVKYLISKGADLLAVNADGNMPYDICEDEVTLDYIESEMAKRGITQEMIDETRATTERIMLSELKKMVEIGEDLESRDNQGATPLHIAAANGYISVVEFLLDNHVSTDPCDNDLWQPIHAAACWGHPDVLELLVQNGADINAKTKNGETPFDICEDPELKERIIQLKNEMETKKASQPNRLKRSHSQNTRSHSVRRTSIREKSQISRREAREEARLRHEKESQDDDDDDNQSKLNQYCQNAKDNDKDYVIEKNHLSAPSLISSSTSSHQDYIPFSNDNDDNINNCIDLNNIDFVIDTARKKSIDSDSEFSTSNNSSQLQSHNINTNNNSNINNSNTNVNNNSNNSNTTVNTSGKDAIVIRNTGYLDKDSQVNISSATASDHLGQIQASSRTSTSNVNESVKVEIHVTVNTTPTYNTGTLADLKKQRAEKHRNSLSLSTQSTDQSPSVVHRNSLSLPNNTISNNNNNNNNNNNSSSHSISATYFYEPPPSPSTTIKKFRGDPSDIVGETRKRGCCTIM